MRGGRKKKIRGIKAPGEGGECGGEEKDASK